MYALELYEIGVLIWLLGFTLHLYGAYWQHSYTFARFGAVFCWIGFAATALPLLESDLIPQFEWPGTIDFRNPTTKQIYAVVWTAWILGFSIVAARWLRILPGYIGWIGFTIGMAATVAFWTEARLVQAAIAAVALLLIIFTLGSKGAGSRRSTRPGDYQAELLRLCYGDTAVASRLIRLELKRRPSMSRQGAAMAAVTRLKHDRR